MRQAGFPVVKTLTEFDLAASSIPPATFDYLSSLPGYGTLGPDIFVVSGGSS